jgi:hypothetical protein
MDSIRIGIIIIPPFIIISIAVVVSVTDDVGRDGPEEAALFRVSRA